MHIIVETPTVNHLKGSSFTLTRNAIQGAPNPLPGLPGIPAQIRPTDGVAKATNEPHITTSSSLRPKRVGAINESGQPQNDRKLTVFELKTHGAEGQTRTADTRIFSSALNVRGGVSQTVIEREFDE